MKKFLQDVCFVHSLGQHRLNEVFLQLLVDQLKLDVCLLTPEKSIVDAHSQVVQLGIEHEDIFPLDHCLNKSLVTMDHS